MCIYRDGVIVEFSKLIGLPDFFGVKLDYIWKGIPRLYMIEEVNEVILSLRFIDRPSHPSSSQAYRPYRPYRPCHPFAPSSLGDKTKFEVLGGSMRAYVASLPCQACHHQHHQHHRPSCSSSSLAYHPYLRSAASARFAVASQEASCAATGNVNSRAVAPVKALAHPHCRNLTWRESQRIIGRCPPSPCTSSLHTLHGL